MSRPARFKGKTYRPAKFGERMRPGTVEWEMNRRKDVEAERAAQQAWKKRQPEPEREPRFEDYGVSHALMRPWRVFSRGWGGGLRLCLKSKGRHLSGPDIHSFAMFYTCTHRMWVPNIGCSW